MTKAEELLDRIAKASESQLEISRQAFTALSDLVMVLKPREVQEKVEYKRRPCKFEGCSIHAAPQSEFCPVHPLEVS